MPPTDPDAPTPLPRSLEPLAYPGHAAGAAVAQARRVAALLDAERQARASGRRSATQDWTGTHRLTFDAAVVRLDRGLGDARDALVRLAGAVEAAAHATAAENRRRDAARTELAAERAAAEAAYRRAEIGAAP